MGIKGGLKEKFLDNSFREFYFFVQQLTSAVSGPLVLIRFVKTEKLFYNFLTENALAP